MVITLTTYLIFYSACVLAIILFYVVNVYCEPYRKDITAFERALGKDCRETALPPSYRRSYEIYRRSSGQLPSQCIKFVIRKQKFALLLLPLFSVLVCLLNCLYCAYHKNNFTIHAVSMLIVVYLFTVSLLFLRAFHCRAQVRARSSLSTLLTFWDISLGRSAATEQEPTPDDLAQKVLFLTENGINSVSAEKIATLLSRQKLDGAKTIEEQKKLNTALNGLLAVVSKSCNVDKDA